MLIEGCKHELEITVPLEDIQKETERIVADIQKRAALPGFRPGKAPASLIRKRFEQDIRQDVLEHLLPKAFRARVEQEALEVVSQPDVSDLHYHEGEPLRFKAKFEVAPEITLNQYRDVEVEYGEETVTSEMIDQRVEELRQQKAEYVNEDPRPLADGDFAVVHLKSIQGVEGEPIDNDNMMLHIGDAETMPEFSENLRGMSPGEQKEFDVKYPEDYAQPRIAGKTVRFLVDVKAVRRKELPELNDEFARDLGDYQTLEELREAVRRSIQGEFQYRAQQEAKDAIIEKIIDLHEFPIPEAYVDRQIQNQLEQQLRSLQERGIDPKSLNLDWAKIRESQKERATRDVKGSLLLEKIGEVEAIHASNDEVDREIQRFAKQQREPVAAVRMRLEKDGTLARLAARIRTEKIRNFLFENARKVAKTEAPASETPGE